MRQLSRYFRITFGLLIALFLSARVASASPVFSFNLGSDLLSLQTTNAALANNVINGFTAAANRWSSLLSDNVTLNFDINFAALAPNVIGQSGSNTVGVSYANVRTALINDSSGASDALAVASLSSGSALQFLTNNRAGSVVLDNDGSANNSVLDVNRANAKALGLLAANDTASVGTITFSSSFAFDFNPLDGITAGQTDFVGVATHEIGHSLGFVSGVDTVDYFSGPNGPGKNDDLNGATAGIGTLDPFRVFSVLDLYRYSGAGVRNLAAGSASYFSIDGGVTSLSLFSTGSFNGDGRQASHWKDNLGLGIMDPTTASGELLAISANDIRALDVIGWNLTSVSSVPEPTSLLLLGTGLTGLVLFKRKKAV